LNISSKLYFYFINNLKIGVTLKVIHISSLIEGGAQINVVSPVDLPPLALVKIFNVVHEFNRVRYHRFPVARIFLLKELRFKLLQKLQLLPS